jgi:hypothetical protein
MTAMSAHSASAIDAANPFPDRPAIRGNDASPQPPRPARRFPTPRFGDYSRTRFESRVAFGGADETEDAEDSIATPTRQFSLLEITSGLPDDSREADEKQAGRRLRDLRARVKVARATISANPDAAEVLRQDWVKAARFYARFGLTEAMFRRGIPLDEALGTDVSGLQQSPEGGTSEVRARESAALPDSGPSVYAPARL